MFGVSLTLAIVDAIVVFGNLCVFYILVKHKSLKTPTNSLVLSLTISDLLLGMFILPFAIIQEHKSHWMFGRVGCRIWLSLDVWLSTASIYNLLAISFDRYMAVRQPIKYTIISSTRVVRLMTFLVWFCSFILACILFFLETMLHDPEYDDVKQCQPTSLPSLYIIFSASASFIVPAVVMVVLNARIFCTVLSTSRSTTVIKKTGQSSSLRVHRGRKRSLPKVLRAKFEPKQEDSVVVKDENSQDSTCRSELEMSEPKEKEMPTLRTLLSHTVVFGVIEAKKTTLINTITQRRCARHTLRTELRVARTTAIVVGAFVVCWIPFTTIYVLQAYSVCTVSAGCVPTPLYLVAFWLGYSNSAVNPLLYAAFSRDFRNAFRRILFNPRK